MTSWVRWYHETSTDPKWRVIARKSGQRIGDVLAVWSIVLTNASANANERGRTLNLVHDDIAAALDLETDQVTAIIVAMEGKVICEGKLSGWEKRNPIKDDGASERAKRWRERKRTQTNGTNATDKDKDSDSDSERKKDNSSSNADEAIPPLLEEFWDACPKKVGKEATRRQYSEALVKVDPPVLVQAMKKYAASIAGKDPKYILHPKNWLLNESWKDCAPTVVETINPEALAKLRAQWGGAAGEIIDDIGIASFKTWLERCVLLDGPPKKLIADSAYKAHEIDKRFGVQLRKRLGEYLIIEAAA